MSDRNANRRFGFGTTLVAAAAAVLAALTANADFRRTAVIESLALLPRRIGARLVAEGVETIGELAAVRAAGVELIQGHLFSPAVPASQLTRLELLDLETPRGARPGLVDTALGA